MGYKTDRDLEFLGRCTQEELAPLFNLLLNDLNDNKERYLCRLHKSEGFKKYKHNYPKYWETIAEELQYFGGNTIINQVLNEGVLYEKIVKDVAKELDIVLKENMSTEEIENWIIERTLNNFLNEINNTEMKKMVESFLDDIPNEMCEKILDSILLDQGDNTFKESFVSKILADGGVATYNLMLKTKEMVWSGLFGKGADFKIKNAISKVLLTVISGGLSLSKGATRITVPAVFLISTMRKKQEIDYRLGSYKNGKKEDEWVTFHDKEKTKKRFVVFYVNGKREGLGKRYYGTDELKWECNYTNDKKNGQYKEYDENGKCIFVCSFENDEKVGIGQVYNEKGKLVKEYRY